MQARVTRFEVQPGRLDEVIRIIQEQIVPDVRAVEGNQGISVLTNAGANTGLVITWWESADIVALLEQTGFWEQQVARAIFHIAAVPGRETYDVLLRE